MGVATVETGVGEETSLMYCLNFLKLKEITFIKHYKFEL